MASCRMLTAYVAPLAILLLVRASGPLMPCQRMQHVMHTR